MINSALQVSTQSTFFELNLMKSCRRNYRGYLIRTTVESPTLDLLTLGTEIKFLQEYMFLMSFAGEWPKPALLHPAWLNWTRRFTFGTVICNHEAGCGFYYLKNNSPKTTRKILMLTAYWVQWGMAIFQPWVSALNHVCPCGLKLLTWNTLKQLPIEYHSGSYDSATSRQTARFWHE